MSEENEVISPSASEVYKKAYGILYEGANSSKAYGLKLMSVAARMGHPDAQNDFANSGIIGESNVLMERTAEDKNMWNARAFQGGSYEAARDLCEAFQNGEGVEQDLQEAYAYAREAFIRDGDSRKDYSKSQAAILHKKLMESGMTEDEISSISFKHEIEPVTYDYSTVTNNVTGYNYFQIDAEGAKSGSTERIIGDVYTEAYENEFADLSLEDTVKKLNEIDLLLSRDSMRLAKKSYETSINGVSTHNLSSNYIDKVSLASDNYKTYNKLMAQQMYAVSRIHEIDPKNINLDFDRLSQISHHIIDRDSINNSMGPLSESSLDEVSSLNQLTNPDSVEPSPRDSMNESSSPATSGGNPFMPGREDYNSTGIGFDGPKLLKMSMILNQAHKDGVAPAYFDSILANATDAEKENMTALSFSFLNEDRYGSLVDHYPDINEKVEKRISDRLNNESWIENICQESGMTRDEWDSLPESFRTDMATTYEHEIDFPKDSDKTLGQRLGDSKDVLMEGLKGDAGQKAIKYAGWAASIATGGVALKVGIISAKYFASKLSENKSFMDFLGKMGQESKNALDRAGVPTEKIALGYSEMKEGSKKLWDNKFFKVAAVAAAVTAAIIYGMPEEAGDIIKGITSGDDLLAATGDPGLVDDVLAATDDPGLGDDVLAATGDPGVLDSAADKVVPSVTSSELGTLLDDGPVNVNVTGGDTLWGIAKKSLEAMGHEATNTNIANAVNSIYESNAEAIGADPNKIFADRTVINIDPNVINESMGIMPETVLADSASPLDPAIVESGENELAGSLSVADADLDSSGGAPVQTEGKKSFLDRLKEFTGHGAGLGAELFESSSEAAKGADVSFVATVNDVDDLTAPVEQGINGSGKFGDYAQAEPSQSADAKAPKDYGSSQPDF